MALTRRRSTRRRGPRRQMLWARTMSPAGGTALAAAAILQVDLLADFETATGARVQGATIVAIRGQIQVFTGVAPALCQYAIGVNDRNVGAGTLGPAGGARYNDWMFYEASWAGPGTQPFPTHQGPGPLNIRSRRKLSEINETLWLAFESAAGSSAQTVMYQISALLAMP